MNGWIKLHKKIKEWEWYKDTNTKSFFFHLIITCNFKPTKWRGINLEIGECAKSLETLSEESSLSIQNLRTSIKRLKSTGEVTERQHGKHRILKVENYASYQIGNTMANREVTRTQQGSNREVTLEEEYNKEKNEKNTTTVETISQILKTPTEEFDEQVELLIEKYPSKDLESVAMKCTTYQPFDQRWLKFVNMCASEFDKRNDPSKGRGITITH